MSGDRMMIYGAYGYTGELAVREAKAAGLEPVLAGRSADKLAAVAARGIRAITGRRGGRGTLEM